MAFKMKGHTLPGFKQKKEGNMETVEVRPQGHADSANNADINYMNDAVPNTTFPNKKIYDYENDPTPKNTIHVATEAHDRGKPAGYNAGGTQNDPRLDVYDIGGMRVGVDANLRNNMRDRGLINAAEIKEEFGFDIDKEEAVTKASKERSLSKGHKKDADYSGKTSHANKYDFW